MFKKMKYFLVFFVVIFGCIFFYIKSLTITNENIEIKTTLIDTFSKEVFIDNIFRENKILNKKLKKYILNNFDKFDKNNLESSILNYSKLYKKSFDVLSILKKTAKINIEMCFKLHKNLSNFNFEKVDTLLKILYLKNKNVNVIAHKYFFEGIIAELSFENPENLYKKGIELNGFDPDSYIVLGNYYFFKNDFKQSNQVFGDGFKKSTFYKKDRKKMELLYKLGISQSKISSIEANLTFTDLLIESLFYKNIYYKYLAVYNIGILKRNIDDLKYALKLALKLNNKKDIFNSMSALSKVYYENKNYENSKFYILKSILLAKKNKNLVKIKDSSKFACLNYIKLKEKNYIDLYCGRVDIFSNKINGVLYK
jgi:hypothetical protein